MLIEFERGIVFTEERILEENNQHSMFNCLTGGHFQWSTRMSGCISMGKHNAFGRCTSIFLDSWENNYSLLNIALTAVQYLLYRNDNHSENDEDRFKNS